MFIVLLKILGVVENIFIKLSPVIIKIFLLPFRKLELTTTVFHSYSIRSVA